MKTVLVTGGAGFIGSNLADALLAQNYRVVILDNLSTGKKENVPAKAIFCQADVRRKSEVDAIFKKYTPDVVFHIAGQASTISSFMDPSADTQVNFIGTMNVVLSCLKHKVPRLLYASSMTVYGHPRQLPIAESHLCRPISYYGITKYAAERFVHATSERNDLKTPLAVTSFRMFNVYGPRQGLTNPYQGAMAIFIGNVLRGDPVIIFGDGKQSRDFIYIDDVARAWIGAIDNPKSFGYAFNLGWGRMISINDLVHSIIKALGKNPAKYPIKYRKARPGDQRFMEADISLARRLLAYKPAITFGQGLKQTVAWATNYFNQ